MKYIILILSAFIIYSCSPKEKKLLVDSDLSNYSCYFFFITDCPASRNNLFKIQLLYDSLSQNGLTVTGILSDPDLDTNKLNITINEFNINFPILEDTLLNIAKFHNAKVTPELFVYYMDSVLIYSGQIDDYYYDLSKHRKIISNNYVMSALSQHLNSKKVEIPKTKPIGCKINFDYFSIN